MGQLLFISYIYAQLGIQFFGVVMKDNINLSIYGLDKNYMYLNFNDFPNSILYMFHMLIINNCNMTVNIFLGVEYFSIIFNYFLYFIKFLKYFKISYF